MLIGWLIFPGQEFTYAGHGIQLAPNKEIVYTDICKSKYTPGLSRCLLIRGCISTDVQINFHIFAIAFTCQKIHPGANYTYMYDLHTVCSDSSYILNKKV